VALLPLRLALGEQRLTLKRGAKRGAKRNSNGGGGKTWRK